MSYTNKLNTEKYTAIFPSRLRDLMDQHKEITISVIASKLGISTAAVSAYKRGETMPKLEYAPALADCFDVSLDYLTGRSDIPSRNETIQSIGAHTGLSEKAVRVLLQLAGTDSNEERKRHLIQDLICLPEKGYLSVVYEEYLSALRMYNERLLEYEKRKDYLDAIDMSKEEFFDCLEGTFREKEMKLVLQLATSIRKANKN